MFEFLLRPLLLPSPRLAASPTSTSSSISCPASSLSSRRSSVSSSVHEVRPIHTEIIQRNLITDFLEATSLPVNVPIHRDLEAVRWEQCPRCRISRDKKLENYNFESLLCDIFMVGWVRFLAFQPKRLHRIDSTIMICALSKQD